MDFLKKNKIIVAIVVIVLVLGGGFFYLKSGGSKSQAPSSQQQVEVKQLKPEDIGLELALKDDKKAVVMTVTKLDGIKSIEYEVSYNAKNTDTSVSSEDGESTGDIPRGVVASPIEVNGQSKITKEILLGTCSRNICKYDQVTSDIKFIIKVNFTNGEIGSVEASVPLEK